MSLGEYIVFVVSVSALTGVIGLLSHSALEKEVRGAIGVIGILTLLSPLLSLLSGMSSGGIPVPDKYIPAEGGYADVSEEAFLLGVGRYLSESYSLSADNIEIMCNGFEPTQMRADGITVSLSGSAAVADVRMIREDIKNNFLTSGGEARVVILFEG